MHFIHVDEYDTGYDFIIDSKYFDGKTTVFRESNMSFDSFRKIIYNKYHLYVAKDQGQYHNSKAEFYIQVLVTADKTKALLCGYTKKDNLKPSHNKNNIYQAMEVPISELTPMEKMNTDEDLLPRCWNCGSVIISGRQFVEYQMAQSFLKHKMILCPSCQKAMT